jgi:hypothetical protein
MFYCIHDAECFVWALCVPTFVRLLSVQFCAKNRAAVTEILGAVSTEKIEIRQIMKMQVTFAGVLKVERI